MTACSMTILLLILVVSSVSGFVPSPPTRSAAGASPAYTFAGQSPTTSTTTLHMAAGGVVITGAAGGVGFAYAGEFMDRGYDVVICDVRDCTAAAKALEQRHPTGGKVFHTNCDVSDAKSIEKLAQFATSNLETVNFWINNAGVNGGRRDLRDVPVSQVELVVKVNLMGTLLCTKAAMEIMGEQVGGQEIVVKLVNILLDVFNFCYY